MSVENISPVSYTVFKDKDNVFKAKTNSGTILAFNTICRPVIQSAIDAAAVTPTVGGKVFIMQGLYSGANINIPQKVTVEGEGFATQLYGNVTISGGQDQYIRNLWINGNDSSGYALTIQDAVTTTCEDVKISQLSSNSGIAVYVDGGSNFGALNRFVRCTFTADWRGVFVPYSGFGVNSLQISDSLFSWGNQSGDTGPLSGSIAIETAGHGLQKNFLYDNLYIERWDVGIRHDDAAFVARKIWIDGCNQGIHVTSGAEAAGNYDIEVRTVTTQSGLVNINGRLISGENLRILPSNTIMSQIGISGAYLKIVASSGNTGNAESIVRFVVPDDPNAFVSVENITTASGLMTPAIVMHAGNNAGAMANLIGDVTVGFDTGLQPAIKIAGRQISGNGIAGMLATRPIVQVMNNTTPMVTVSPIATQLHTSLSFASGASGISFSGMQMLPSMAEQAKYVIWVSGATTRAVRTADGVIEYSGGSGFASTVIQGALDATYSGFGGKVQLREGLFDLAGSGLNFNTSRSGRVELGGVLDATILAYAGVTYSGNAAITISGAATTTPNDTFYLHDLCINCGTVTSGRNAIDVLQAGIGYIERIRINNADIGIDYFDSNGVWTRDIHVRTGFVGLRTRGGPVTNANAMFFDGLECVDMSQAGAIMNADNAKSAFAGAITNSDFELNSGAYGVVFDGGITNFKIDSCYFENNTSGDIYLKGQSGGGFKPSNTTIVNCRFSNSNSVTSGVGGAIVIDFAAKTVIDNCQFFQRVSGCAILFNASGFSALDKIFVRNPTLSSVPYLIDNTYGLGTARNFGTVEEDSRRGVIIMNGSAACVEGDVVQAGGGNNLFATTTTSGVIGPAAVMYGNSAANKPCVIATDGISPVLTISGTVRGELLGSSTTTKAAAVMSGVQVNQCIGWSVEGFLSGVKVNCKIL